jgi:hypothetical protein
LSKGERARWIGHKKMLADDVEAMADAIPAKMIRGDVRKAGVVVKPFEARSFYLPPYNEVQLSMATNEGTMWHEFGHALENGNAVAMRKIRAFRDKRFTEAIRNGEKFVAASPGRSVAQERAIADKFFIRYAGRYYGDMRTPEELLETFNDFGHTGLVGNDTELLSMGLQALRDPAFFAEMMTKDPEHLDVILDILLP